MSSYNIITKADKQVIDPEKVNQAVIRFLFLYFL